MAMPPKKFLRRLAIACLALLGVLALAAGGFAAWLTHADLKSILESEGSDRLHRSLTLGSLKIGWGDPIAIEITDLTLANASWGSVPVMARVGHLSALLDLRSLLSGTVRYERLRLEDTLITLERDPSGLGNWKFGGASGSGGGMGIVPKNRTQFPTLIDAALARLMVTFRTSSGKILHIGFDTMAIATADDDAPVTLKGSGAYNGVPITLDGRTQSSNIMRDARQPFGLAIALAAPDTRLRFEGTLTEPLDFEGARGSFALDAATLNDLAKAGGLAIAAKIPLSLKGTLARERDDWSLADATGTLADDPFTGKFALHEGAREKPDDITLDEDFKTLDLDALMARLGHKKAGKLTDAPLRTDLTDVNIAARIGAGRLTMAHRAMADSRIDAALLDGDVTVRSLRLGVIGGTFNGAGALKQTGTGGRLTLDARLDDADAGLLAKELGAKGDEIAGRLDGGATIDMTGATVGDALKTGSGTLVLVLDKGSVQRALIEGLSVDLRALFRTAEGRVPITCFLSLLSFRNGTGRLGARLQSADATILGAGRLDPAPMRLDLTVKSESATTGFFALDAPISIRGPIDHLSVVPLAGGDGFDRARADVKTAAGELPADLDALVRAHSCAL